jgi:hypothetical protein
MSAQCFNSMTWILGHRNNVACIQGKVDISRNYPNCVWSCRCSDGSAGWTAEVRFPAGARYIYLSSIASSPALGLTQPPHQCVPWPISLGVKRPWCETDNPPSSAEVSKGTVTLLLPNTSSWRSTGTILTSSINQV